MSINLSGPSDPDANEENISVNTHETTGQNNGIRPGLVLGEIYLLQHLLGRGGMGEVWLATHLLLNEPRAIKLLLGSYSQNPQMRERFVQAEARHALRLQHPHIVRVYDLGQFQGAPYIVMEYIEGRQDRQDLKKLLKTAGHLSPDQAATILEQTAQALAAAHDQGLIHRDLKPANILITADDQVKLTDFGLIKDIQSDTSLTADDQALGTPLYMSPEQAKGKAETRSDLYSLACVLYEMLTGQPPFVGDLTSLLIAHAATPVVPPSRLNPSITSAVDAVIIKALAKTPAQRWSSVQKFVAAYRQALQNQPTPTETTQDYPTIEINVESTLPAKVQSPNNLPSQLTQMLGREKDFNELKERLSQPKVRLVSLTGVGGTGKTTLALAVATDLLPDFENGIWWVELDTLNDPTRLGDTIAATLQIAQETDHSTLTTLKEYFQDKKILLVLDNFEQLVGGAIQLVELLKGSTGLKMLVTSRIALQIAPEREYPLEPLVVPGSKEVELSPTGLAEYASVALFVARAQALKPTFQLDAHNASAVAAICVRLDGLPLAIELAAARTKFMTPQEILQRLSLKLLASSARDLPARQQTLRGAVDWSYDLLNEFQKKLFCRLALFANGWTLDAAEQTCEGQGIEALQIIDLLWELINQSLIIFEEHKGQSRFRMLQIIREYALEKLEESGQKVYWQERQTVYFGQKAADFDKNSLGPTQAEAFQQIQLEHDNLRATLDWLIESQQTDLAVQISTLLYRFWHWQGLWKEGYYYLSKALALPGGNNAPSRGMALYALGVLQMDHKDTQGATRYFEEALEFHRQTDNKAWASSALNGLGIIAQNQGAYLVALNYYLEGLELSRQSDDLVGTAALLSNIANNCMMSGNLEQARQYILESLQLRRMVGDKRGEAFSLGGLGELAMELEKYEQAQDYFQQALTISQELGEQLQVSWVFSNLGSVAIERQDYNQARLYFNKSLDISREVGSIQQMLGALLGQADLYYRLGQYLVAQNCLLEYLQLVEKLQSSNLPTDSLILWNIILVTRPENLAAAARLEGAIENSIKNNAYTPMTQLNRYRNATQNTLKTHLSLNEYTANVQLGETMTFEEIRTLVRQTKFSV